ncbi:MAG: YHS domain-containing (seleno)protein [Bacteroidia bacterium]
MKNITVKYFIISLFTLSAFIQGCAQSPYSEIYTTRDGAIKGYDPVAYFTEGKAVKGAEPYSFKWKDATWYFSSPENLATFKANPEKYAPQYGGYCAYGVADGHKASITPEAFTILDGKLYLNYNQQIHERWNKDQQGYIKTADEKWGTVKKEKF